ncbi:MAG: hypothetical protein C5B51_09755 [Terriglobia bacterium]|nr:MAG: hypothetical protein C5B51_09755 [Terriglobia bacterium]
MDLPARIGKYELEEFLGGGMSQVFRARDTVIGRTVAVKILTEKGREDGEVKARFLAEARTAGNISHENILGIYDFGEDDQHRPFIVMEFLRGEDLRSAIKNGHTGDLSGKLRIALQLARALEYVHSQSIVHRDLKPENVHLTGDGHVKLMDFGISKRTDLDLTRTGYMVGTPYYMAPEQVNGGDITPQVDVYAFGILLYELISGIHPIRGETMERVFYSILSQSLDLEPLRQSRIPESICRLIEECTAKEAARRPRGFTSICGSLERVIAETKQTSAEQSAPTLVMPERQPVPSSRPRSWWMIAVLAVALAAAAAVFFALRPAPAPADMVLVPAGPFLFGENKERFTRAAFYIDRTEVTNAAYMAFCTATHHEMPPDFPRDKPEYPVVNVTIRDAQDFARAAGKRLPTAQEWEKAARGADGRLFPWGSQPDAARVNIGAQMLRPVPDFTAGASPYGALQMLGNAWEFVDQMTTPSPGTRAYFATRLMPPPAPEEPWYAIRGGAFNTEKLDGRLIWDSAVVPARWRNPNLGFRCVRDVR